MKKIICIAVCLSLCLGFFKGNDVVEIIAPPDVFAESISEMKEQISQIESEMKGIESEIDSLEGDIADKQAAKQEIINRRAAVEEKIRECEKLLSKYDGQIEKFNADIDAKEAELEESKDLFKRRIRAMSMTGSNNTLNLLMGADYFGDYLTMERFTEGLADYDKALIKRIENAMTELDKKIKRKNKAIAEQEEIKSQLASQRSNLESQQSEIQQLENSLQNDKKNLSEQLKELEAQEAQIEANIAAAYEAARQQALQNNIKYDGKGFAWPVPGFRMITSPFGNRFDPYYHVYRMHNGIDISGSGIAGQPIVASSGGQVVDVQSEYESGGYGIYVIVSHGYDDSGNLITTHYAHMSGAAVSEGQTVNQGDILGYVGTTGASTGYHLHFEVRVNNVPQNPLAYTGS